MLFRSIAVASIFAAQAFAGYAEIVASLGVISKDTAKLNNSVVAFNGEFIFSIPILGDNIQLNEDLESGTKTAQNSSTLTDSEAINLVGPVQSLSGDVEITVNNLISKYDAFKKNNLVGIVYVTLQVTRGNSQKYSGAIIEKVPTALQETARNIAAPIDKAFERALAKYSS